MIPGLGGATPKAVVQRYARGKVQEFHLTSGQTVIVRGYTQHQLNNLHERLQLILSAGGQLTSLKENANGTIAIKGRLPTKSNLWGPFGWIQQYLVLPSFKNLHVYKDATFSGVWHPSGRVTQPKASPPVSPIAQTVPGLGQIGNFFGSLGRIPSWIKAHPIELIVGIVGVVLLISAAATLAGGGEE